MLSIDLHSPQGNAFTVMGAVRGILRQLRVPREDQEKYTKEAMSGDYHNLLQISKDILDKHHISYDFQNDPTEESDEEDDWEDWDDDE